jgi:hypothetical protein
LHLSLNIFPLAALRLAEPLTEVMERPSLQSDPTPAESNIHPFANAVAQGKSKEASDFDQDQRDRMENVQSAAPVVELEEHYYAQGWRLFLILSSLLLSVFC